MDTIKKQVDSATKKVLPVLFKECGGNTEVALSIISTVLVFIMEKSANNHTSLESARVLLNSLRTNILDTLSESGWE